MSIPTDYQIRRNGHSYEVWHEHFGLLIEDCETYGSAEDHAHEHAAERAEMAQFELSQSLADAVGTLRFGHSAKYRWTPRHDGPGPVRAPMAWELLKC